MQPYANGPINTFNGGMGSSAIDFIAIPQSISDQVVKCDVIRDDIMNTSDHFVVRLVLNITCSTMIPTCQQTTGSIKWGKIKAETIMHKYTRPVNNYVKSLLDNIVWETCSEHDIESIIDDINVNMRHHSMSLPKSKYKKHVRPYWNDKLTDLNKKKVMCHRVCKSHGCPKGDNCRIWVDHKNAKKRFRSELKYVQRQYEANEINEIMKYAEVDKNKFWRKLKNSRKSQSTSTCTIRNPQGKVVHDTHEVVNVWMNHFSNLCTEKENLLYDDDHYHDVGRHVNEWYSQGDPGPFLDDPVISDEVSKAVKCLNKGKSPGHDSISAENLQHAGPWIFDLLAGLFNRIIHLEYIPQNFKTGTQIPLFKGKNLCALDPNSYRGITLLTNLNKVFEMVLWRRMEDWWEENSIISKLQGACKSGSPCVHSALVLQETIAAGLDTNDKVFCCVL